MSALPSLSHLLEQTRVQRRAVKLKSPKKNKDFSSTEEIEQTAVIFWKNCLISKRPELSLLFANLNGVRLSIGSAVKAKRLGNAKGLPDLMLLVKRNVYSGLFIELKRKGRETEKMGGLSPEQVEVMEKLRANGFAVFVCYGAQSAIDLIEKYLDGKIK